MNEKVNQSEPVKKKIRRNTYNGRTNAQRQSESNHTVSVSLIKEEQQPLQQQNEQKDIQNRSEENIDGAIEDENQNIATVSIDLLTSELQHNEVDNKSEVNDSSSSTSDESSISSSSSDGEDDIFDEKSGLKRVLDNLQDVDLSTDDLYDHLDENRMEESKLTSEIEQLKNELSILTSLASQANQHKLEQTHLLQIFASGERKQKKHKSPTTTTTTTVATTDSSTSTPVTPRIFVNLLPNDDHSNEEFTATVVSLLTTSDGDLSIDKSHTSDTGSENSSGGRNKRSSGSRKNSHSGTAPPSYTSIFNSHRSALHNPPQLIITNHDNNSDENVFIQSNRRPSATTLNENQFAQPTTDEYNKDNNSNNNSVENVRKASTSEDHSIQYEYNNETDEENIIRNHETNFHENSSNTSIDSEHSEFVSTEFMSSDHPSIKQIEQDLETVPSTLLFTPSVTTTSTTTNTETIPTITVERNLVDISTNTDYTSDSSSSDDEQSTNSQSSQQLPLSIQQQEQRQLLEIEAIQQQLKLSGDRQRILYEHVQQQQQQQQQQFSDYGSTPEQSDHAMKSARGIVIYSNSSSDSNIPSPQLPNLQGHSHYYYNSPTQYSQQPLHPQLPTPNHSVGNQCNLNDSSTSSDIQSKKRRGGTSPRSMRRKQIDNIAKKIKQSSSTESSPTKYHTSQLSSPIVIQSGNSDYLRTKYALEEFKMRKRLEWERNRKLREYREDIREKIFKLTNLQRKMIHLRELSESKKNQSNTTKSKTKSSSSAATTTKRKKVHSSPLRKNKSENRVLVMRANKGSIRKMPKINNSESTVLNTSSSSSSSEEEQQVMLGDSVLEDSQLINELEGLVIDFNNELHHDEESSSSTLNSAQLIDHLHNYKMATTAASPPTDTKSHLDSSLLDGEDDVNSVYYPPDVIFSFKKEKTNNEEEVLSDDGLGCIDKDLVLTDDENDEHHEELNMSSNSIKNRKRLSKEQLLDECMSEIEEERDRIRSEVTDFGIALNNSFRSSHRTSVNEEENNELFEHIADELAKQLNSSETTIADHHEEMGSSSPPPSLNLFGGPIIDPFSATTPTSPKTPKNEGYHRSLPLQEQPQQSQQKQQEEQPVKQSPKSPSERNTTENNQKVISNDQDIVPSKNTPSPKKYIDSLTIESSFQMLRDGEIMKKYDHKGKGKPKKKYVWVDTTTKAIHWRDSNKRRAKAKSAVIQSIVPGITLKNQKELDKINSQSFTILTAKEKPILLVAPTSEICNDWLKVLDVLLQRIN